MEQFHVDAWEERVTIPTYGIGEPDKNPMFFEKRVYQGSSGKVYPNPIVEKIYNEKEDKDYIALFLENKYLKIMVLPELGGRVQMAYDKIGERHFIYYNQVIKPALVGLTGPWISGGIEFNWPQHHRPSTFEPVDYTIIENSDGSKTIWVNEVEKMFRTKGMAGFTLYPDRAYLEIKGQLYNRTDLPQTFLWWANPAVKVNDDYQSVFPPDVNAVFDHGKRDVSTFPIAKGTYYKVDYSPGTDISRYKNIPVPTSYMAINSAYDFLGGYEHDTQAGVLHVANHHVSPGKKQWTWGNGDFGKAWDRNLTDEDGPYIELMTGVFTDNQPDFSWLMPYEEKTFTQYFLPYRELGVVKNANKDVLVGLETNKAGVALKIFATSAHPMVRIELYQGDQVVFDTVVDISPEAIFQRQIDVEGLIDENNLLLLLTSAAGREIIRYQPSKNKVNDIPDPAKPALEPADVDSTEQLFLTAQHLEQYRHATYSPVSYYEEALRRDPGDIRNNNGLGLWFFRRGQFSAAEPYFRKAVERLTQRNPNPYDSEALYNLGLCLKYQRKDDEAYGYFYKATWSSAFQSTGYFSVAQLDIARRDYSSALIHIQFSLDRNACNSKAHVLKSAALRHLQRLDEALLACKEALARDPFNLGALFEEVKLYEFLGSGDKSGESLSKLLDLSRRNSNTLTEYALDYSAAGLYAEAVELLALIAEDREVSPLVYYHLGYFHYELGNNEEGLKQLKKAQSADSYLCFPNRLEDIIALGFAITKNHLDSKAFYYLGNLLYDKQQYTAAITNWELSVELDPLFPTAFRNLGIAYFNKKNDGARALESLEKAFALDKSDARVLMELDQLYKRLNKDPRERLSFLEDNPDLVNFRDDLYLERIALYNLTGGHAKAYELLMQRKFNPWEGGEGKASGQYVGSLIEMAKDNIREALYDKAINQLEAAQLYPHNLGEGKLHGVRENDIFYWLGVAYEGLSQGEKAREYFTKATQGSVDLGVAMFYNDQQPDKVFYQGLAWQKLGDTGRSKDIFEKLLNYGTSHRNDQVKIDYFAVSLPDLLIFDDNLGNRNRIHCNLMIGLGLLGLNRFAEAEIRFSHVLAQDPTNAVAKIHLDLLKELQEAS